MENIYINRESGIPLIGLAYLGILTRNNNSLLQIRPTTACNLNCSFCSTDGGFKSKFHKRNFIVDCEYMLAWIKDLVEYYKEIDYAHIDSVGEPMLYKDLIPLIKGLNQIKGIKKVSMITNGTLLNEKNIQELEKVGLDKINVSLHSLDGEKSKKLFGSENYNVNNVIENLKLLSKTKIELWLAPVYFPKLNEEDIEEIVKFAKELNCNLGIQKYEIHKYGRKIKSVKVQGYDKFYSMLKKLENKYDIKLRYSSNDIKVSKVKRLPFNIEKGENLNVRVLEKGWFDNQVIAAGKNRAISVLNCNDNPNKLIKVKIMDNKHNIYIAKK